MNKPGAILKNAVTAIVTGIVGTLPSILRKKPFCIWYWEPPKWQPRGGPFSARQCRKTIAELVWLGMDPARFTILRKGVEPPAGGPKC